MLKHNTDACLQLSVCVRTLIWVPKPTQFIGKAVYHFFSDIGCIIVGLASFVDAHLVWPYVK